jgi:hypothetical protein
MIPAFFLLAYVVAVVLAALSIRRICAPSTNPVADEHEGAGELQPSGELPPFMLKTSVDGFLEFLARVRAAIRQSQGA